MWHDFSESYTTSEQVTINLLKIKLGVEILGVLIRRNNFNLWRPIWFSLMSLP